ncbi:hypothetical protein [Pseudoxanthomonas dokdonensis]|uniref:hypothetical protein n=1 Tax=Pseudoxanthomonas dokdonensis TaxID=344882 RepID=UPI00070D6AEB|nr:hypothetical protein [Pseudoxanthomonas dokdonensis]
MDAGLRPELTFALLDEKIEALAEGPVAALNSPRWMRRLALLGVVGVAVAFLPSLLLKWLAPQMWMLWVARAGLVMTIAGFVPGIFRSLVVTAREARHHRRGFVLQFDHDVAQFRALALWLSSYPRDVLASSLRYARMGHDRLQSRLGMMVGGIERLGLLPVLVSLFVLLRNWKDLLAVPSWLAMLGVMAAVLWLIGWVAAEFSRRLHLYAFLLEEALECKPA